MGHIASLDTTAEGPFGEICASSKSSIPSMTSHMWAMLARMQMTKLKLAAESNQLPDISGAWTLQLWSFRKGIYWI